MLNIYKIGLKYLGIDKKKMRKLKMFILYLLLKVLCLLLKKANEVFISEKDENNNNFINLNSLALYFIIASRSPEQIEEMKNGNIIKDVLTKL